MPCFPSRSMPLSVALLASILLSACSMPEAPKRTALVYGIARYDIDKPAGSYPNLSLTDDDAASVADMLTRQGWTVTRGIANSAVAAENSAASRQAMEDAIAALAGTTGQVLFYYSGHGYSDTVNSFIIPYGTINNPAMWITAPELLGMFRSAGLKNVIIILDSCNSGGFVYEGATVDAVPPLFDAENVKSDIDYTWFVDSLGDAIKGYISYSADSQYVVLSAAGADEESWESTSTSYGHGIFTFYLLQAGEGRTDADFDGNGYVSTSELYAYCAAKINARWNANSYNEDFFPHVSGTAHEYALWATN